MSSRCIVTGSEGVLGKQLVAELEKRGHNVWGVDLMHSSRDKYFRADVANDRELAHVFDETAPHMVFHLAGEFGRLNGTEHYESLWRTNCTGTQAIINNCVRTGSHLIFASSSEAYGNVADLMNPVHEADLDQVTPKFNNEYALSKFCNEKQVEIGVAHRDLKATVLRFFNAYGPGEKYSRYRSVVCLFVYRLLKGLPITVYRDYHRVFLYVTDWANTVANVADKVQMKHIYNGQTYNIGGEEYCSVETLKDKIIALIGGSDSVITMLDKEKANITNKRPDIYKARHQLDHDPKTTLDQGLPPTIAWMKSTYGI